jgi:hypothetical protein
MQSVGAHHPFAINYRFYTEVNTIHYSGKFERVYEESEKRKGHGCTVRTFNTTYTYRRPRCTVRTWKHLRALYIKNLVVPSSSWKATPPSVIKNKQLGLKTTPVYDSFIKSDCTYWVRQGPTVSFPYGPKNLSSVILANFTGSATNTVIYCGSAARIVGD